MIIALSEDELCFAILVDMCNVACKPLFQLLLSAVQHTHPMDWVDILCAPFSQAVKPFVKEKIQNGHSVADIYAVCKLIRSRINDVSKFHSQGFSDPRAKERLSLQVQALETARNIAFHAQLPLSVKEVHSSLELVLSILTSRFEHALSVDKEKLCELLLYSEQLQSPRQDGQLRYVFPASTITKALLQGSFLELQIAFWRFFARQTQRSDTGAALDDCPKSTDDGECKSFQNLFKRIRKEVSQKGAICSAAVDDAGQKVDCIALCKRILLARNKLAHNESIAVEEIGQAMSDVRTLFRAFRLSCKRAATALDILRSINDEHKSYVCKFAERTSESDMLNLSHNYQRLLHPGQQFFVGRTDELISIQTALQEEVSEERQAVVIFGQAGVGKTCLSLQVAKALQNTFATQKWISCSRREDVYEDVRREKISPATDGLMQSESDRVSRSLATCSAHETHSFRQAQPELWVLDDVCSATVDLITQILTQPARQASVLITTRSRTVKRALEEALPGLFAVDLKPFPLAQSKRLLSMKIGKRNVESLGVADDDHFLEDVLGNLPLSVSIFSSLLIYAKKHKNEDAMQTMVADKNSLLERWREVEERFGDHFHVRGLSGVVDSAEAFLENKPLVALLLAKLCVTNSNSIPWVALQRELQPKHFHDGKFDPRAYHSILKTCWINCLASGLLGVADWLFSNSAKRTLETCRHTLEELGLIIWDASTSCVHIHRLTLQCLQKTLQRRAMFLDNVVVSAGRKHSDIATLASLPERISDVISIELSLDLSKAVVVHLTRLLMDPDHFSKQNIRATLVTLQFARDLQTHLDNTQPRLGRIPSTFKSLCAFLMSKLARPYDGLSITPYEYLDMARTIGNDVAPEALMDFERAWCYLRVAEHSLETSDHTHTRPFFEAALSRAESYMKSSFALDSFGTAWIQCQLAKWLEFDKGRLARREFLLGASKRSPQLMGGQLDNHIKVAHEKIISPNCKIHNLKIISPGGWGTKAQLWCELLRFRIRDGLEDDGVVDKMTMASAHLLAAIFEKLRCVYSVRLGEELADQRGCELSTAIYHSVGLLQVSSSEYAIWAELKLHGRAVRALVKAFDVIEKTVFGKGIAISNTGYGTALWTVMLDTCLACCCGMHVIGVESLGSIFIGKAAKWLAHMETPNSKLNSETGRYPNRGDASRSTSLVKNPYDLLDVVSLFAFQPIFDFYKEKEAEKALTHLMRFVDKGLLQTHGTVAGSNQRTLEYFLLNHVECFCGLLGKDESIGTLKRLQELSECEHVSMTWKDAFRQSLEKIRTMLDVTELCAFYKDFVNAREGFTARDLPSAQKHCFQMFAAYRELRRFWKDNEVGADRLEAIYLNNTIVRILHVLLLDTARSLVELYHDQRHYSEATDIMNESLKLAVHTKLPLVVATHRIWCAKFLKTWGKTSETTEQCRTAQEGLEEAFGEDFLEWLSDAPDPATMLQQL